MWPYTVMTPLSRRTPTQSPNPNPLAGPDEITRPVCWSSGMCVRCIPRWLCFLPCRPLCCLACRPLDARRPRPGDHVAADFRIG